MLSNTVLKAFIFSGLFFMWDGLQQGPRLGRKPLKCFIPKFAELLFTLDYLYSKHTIRRKAVSNNVKKIDHKRNRHPQPDNTR